MDGNGVDRLSLTCIQSAFRMCAPNRLREVDLVTKMLRTRRIDGFGIFGDSGPAGIIGLDLRVEH